MDTLQMIEEMAQKAGREEELRQRLLATRHAKDPLLSFCRIFQEHGYELYPMDMIAAGEEFYASMRRSTNGGGENSPMLEGEDDFYELFLAQLQ